MKISYITTYNALDIHNWSGVAYHAAKSLENQGSTLEYISNLNLQYTLRLKLIRKYYELNNQILDISREPNVAKFYAQQAAERINKNSDIIFSPGSIPIAYLKTKKPKVFYTDATFAGMINYYESFSNFCDRTIKNGNLLEQRAIDESKLIIYSSDWAAKSAIDNYKVNPAKIKVVPFGANVKENNRDLTDIKRIVQSRSKNECHLLFIGGDWKRKGGNIAVKIVERLNKTGLKTILHLVGSTDLPSANLPNFIKHYGFISKSTPEGMEQIEYLYQKCHFLLVPSQAEAFGLVIGEGNAFGLPALATNVGGLTTVIKEDINGKTFSLDTPIEHWTKYITNSFSDYKSYCEFCSSSFGEYQDRLNWKVAGNSIVKLLREL
jgi:glycosyltransferase involved in cell wall biosynthesis